MSVGKGFFQPGGESLGDMARARFRDNYTAELARARANGYTEEHDHEHGPQHLLDWATEYLFRGEPVKAAALIAATRALLACAVVEHEHGVPSVPVVDPEALRKVISEYSPSGCEGARIGRNGITLDALPEAMDGIVDRILASGVVQDRATVEREAAAKALEAAADEIRARRLAIGSTGSERDDETWDNGNKTAEARLRGMATEYREGRR